MLNEKLWDIFSPQFVVLTLNGQLTPLELSVN